MKSLLFSDCDMEQGKDDVSNLHQTRNLSLGEL
jgi:hypothetical protein